MTAAPVGVLLRGRQVLLRPLREEELDALHAQMRSADERTMPLGPPARDEVLRRISNGGSLVDGELDLAMEAEGRLVGQIQARHWHPGHPPGVFMLGISMDQAHRGRGIGTEAIALLSDHLFEAEWAERLEVPTDVENGPMRAVAEKLGFVLEGVLRAYMPSSDGRRDYALYTMTKDDWEKRRNHGSHEADS